MKASTLIFALSGILVFSACGDDQSLGKSEGPVAPTGSGGSAGTEQGGPGGSSSGNTGGSSSTTAGSGGSSNGGTGGTTGGSSAGTGGAPAGDGGDGCALVSCAKGTHCVLEQVACIQAPCPPMPTCVKDTVPGGACKLDTDCRLFDNYCGGCACDALPTAAPDPKCDQGIVQCLVQPCRNKTAKCSGGMCVAQ